MSMDGRWVQISFCLSSLSPLFSTPVQFLLPFIPSSRLAQAFFGRTVMSGPVLPASPLPTTCPLGGALSVQRQAADDVDAARELEIGQMGRGTNPGPWPPTLAAGSATRPAT